MPTTETLQRLTEPLKQELAEIEQQIVKLTVELGGLRETQRNIKFVLAKLNPEPTKKKTPRQRGASRTPEILAFLQGHNGQLGDDYGYTNVYRAMRAEGVSIGKEMVRNAFGELHEQGVLRMTRTTSGGGRNYTLVGDA